MRGNTYTHTQAWRSQNNAEPWMGWNTMDIYIYSSQFSTLHSVLAGSCLQLRLLSTQSEAEASPQTESDYHSIIKDTEKGTGESAVSCFNLDHDAVVCIFPLILLCCESDKTHLGKVNISFSHLCHRGGLLGVRCS